MYEINRAKTKHLKKAKTDLYRPNLWNFWRTTASLLNYWSSILNNFWYTNNFETNILHLEKLNWQTFWRRILNKIFRGYVLTVKKIYVCLNWYEKLTYFVFIVLPGIIEFIHQIMKLFENTVTKQGLPS